jgi:hypothetical protein
MHSTQRTARLAGFLYLVLAVTGPFLLMYMPARLFTPGGATATVRWILANQPLFHAYILVGIATELCFVAVVLLLYRLLRETDRELAALMVILVLIDVPLAFAGTAGKIATLSFVTGGGFLDVFQGPQRDVIATLILHADRAGAIASEVLWGLWLLPLGILVLRSRLIPAFLGAWLLANGAAYVALSVIGVAAPQYYRPALSAATPVLLGEVVLALWLVVMGVRSPAPRHVGGRAQGADS